MRFSTTKGWPNLRQPLREDARDDVGIAARREADDEVDRPRRIGFPRRDRRTGRSGKAGRAELKEFPASEHGRSRPHVKPRLQLRFRQYCQPSLFLEPNLSQRR
jgi:hypothetical protein